jgi:hypothetical protein
LAAIVDTTMTDVNAFALELLEFVENCVRTAALNSDSRESLLEEAQCALVVLDRMVMRTAPEVYPFLAFFTDYDFPKIGRDSPEPTAALLDALSGLLKARKVFSN